jgi:hypothetical protein
VTLQGLSLTDDHSADEWMVEYPACGDVGYAEPAVSVADRSQYGQEFLEKFPTSPCFHDYVEVLEMGRRSAETESTNDDGIDLPFAEMELASPSRDRVRVDQATCRRGSHHTGENELVGWWWETKDKDHTRVPYVKSLRLCFSQTSDMPCSGRVSMMEN